MYTTGDKLLNVMKEEEIGIAELARISGVLERTILDIMAGVKEPELGVIIETTKTDAGTKSIANHRGCGTDVSGNHRGQKCTESGEIHRWI